MKKLNKMLLIAVNMALKTIYSIFSFVFPLKADKVTFASYREERLKGNLLYLYEELQNSERDYTFTMLFKKYQSSYLGKVDYVLHLVRACYHLATSAYFVIDDYYYPVYVIKPHKKTKIIQLWHAAGAFKKFGHSTKGKSFGPSVEYLQHVNIHSNYSNAIVSSKEVVPYFAEAFDMPGDRILPLGLPRTDYFYDGKKTSATMAKFQKLYPELNGKKLILYAPTFRGKSHYQESFNLPFDLEEMERHLEGTYALVTHFHPYMKFIRLDRERHKSFVYDLSSDFGIQELMYLCDVLITDYSSVIFEYSLLDKPMCFFPFDLEEYIEERDFYYEYESFIPGPLFRDTSSLVKWLREERFNKEQIHSFRDKFFDYTDGNASKRIVEHLF
ncbi:CDP-glycerol glycerophosphotransferase family protein [Sediminibacillus massiliensis]|uniref:CDP-glycerol glycerophosphotransferase family protein n=1 Tax=Sediminibacillus massiliensis TaxID=1926277 RepID=UPI000988428F|nr:CDP-glycerol glycerophosphotransferase family protein [Sediminibacillus massiliensis]